MNSTDKGNIGEDFVNRIAFNSFMEFWCYPSPKDENGDKKEICDLLILFDKSIFIISVKNYEFKDLYSRYFRRTIDKAVKQIYGAERKLFSLDREIYIKHPNKQIERFPKEKICHIHRIIVNLGQGVKFYPFNKETKDDRFITLFDKEAFETIVQELDTIPDFFEYLRKRELLFSNKTVIIMPGEEYDFPVETAHQFLEYSQEQFNPENKKSILISGTENDLLAHYLKNKRTFPDYIETKEYNGMLIQFDGAWEEFKSNQQVINKKELDKNSYFIDELVKREILTNPNQNSIEIAKELLSFSRFDRRVIADNFLEFYDVYKDSKGNSFSRRYLDFNDIGIVFAFYSIEMPNEMINVLLDLAIDSFCIFSKYKNKKMILIATTSYFKQFKIGLSVDIKQFPIAKEKQILDDVKLLGWFTNYQTGNIKQNEYPDN